MKTMKNKELESLIIYELQMIDLDNGLSRTPNNQEIVDKINDIIYKFNKVLEMLDNGNSTNN